MLFPLNNIFLRKFQPVSTQQISAYNIQIGGLKTRYPSHTNSSYL